MSWATSRSSNTRASRSSPRASSSVNTACTILSASMRVDDGSDSPAETTAIFLVIGLPPFRMRSRCLGTGIRR